MTPEEQAARDISWNLFFLECSHEWRIKGEVDPVNRNLCGDCVREAIAAALRTAREEADAEIAHQRAFRDKAPQALADAVRLAREEEREACARIADWHASHLMSETACGPVGDDNCAPKIARAIRARAQESEG